MADIIFQDCETSPSKSNVHARSEGLATLDATIKGKSGYIIITRIRCPTLKKRVLEDLLLKAKSLI